MTPPAATAFVIAADDPCLDGHFPGAPIVPGVVVLDHVVAAAETSFELAVTGVARCKFRAALYPHERCGIALGAPAAGRLRFTCHGPRGVLADGVLACDDDG